ncbi:MAG: hypothetical protein WBE75_00025 [Candidatus Omnitrophota bacterium]|jgi:hypothetical protein
MKKRISLQEKAVLAMKSAIRGVVRKHKESGRPLAIWKNGRVVKIPAVKL